MSRQPGRWQPEVTLDEVSNLSRDIMSSQTYQQRSQTMTYT